MVSMHATEKQTWFITACFSILWLWLNVFLLHTGANSDFHSKKEKIFKYNLVLQLERLAMAALLSTYRCMQSEVVSYSWWMDYLRICCFHFGPCCRRHRTHHCDINTNTPKTSGEILFKFDFRIKCDTCVHFLFKYLCNLNVGLVTIFYYPAHACLKYK